MPTMVKNATLFGFVHAISALDRSTCSVCLACTAPSALGCSGITIPVDGEVLASFLILSSRIILTRRLRFLFQDSWLQGTFTPASKARGELCGHNG